MFHELLECTDKNRNSFLKEFKIKIEIPVTEDLLSFSVKNTYKIKYTYAQLFTYFSCNIHLKKIWITIYYLLFTYSVWRNPALFDNLKWRINFAIFLILEKADKVKMKKKKSFKGNKKLYMILLLWLLTNSPLGIPKHFLLFFYFFFGKSHLLHFHGLITVHLQFI